MKRIAALMLVLLPSTTLAAQKLPLALGGYASDLGICADQEDFDHKIILIWANDGLSIKPIRETGALCRIEQWKVRGKVFSGKGYCMIKMGGPDADYAFNYRVLNRKSFEYEGRIYRLCSQ